jgi:outer membrane protein, adhesin transport system
VLSLGAETAEPLSVVLARGEGARTMAEVAVARAGMLPGFGASAGIDRSGGIDAGLSLDGEGLGFGRRASMEALAETEELARRKVAEREDDSRRRLVSLEREIASLRAERAQSGSLLAEMEANLPLFTEQYKAGRRSLLELVGQFEAVTRLKRDHATLRYRIALAEVEIAREQGLLVDGGRM